MDRLFCPAQKSGFRADKRKTVVMAHHQIIAEDAVVSVIEAEYIPPYTIHLRFSDGAEQSVNFCSFLEQSHHPDIRKYLNTELFRGFSIADGRLDWNDYELCFSMQDLYEGKNLTALLYRAAYRAAADHAFVAAKISSAPRNRKNAAFDS